MVPPPLDRLRFRTLLLLLSLSSFQAAAVARPVVCSTTLEAPSTAISAGDVTPSPVEVTRCGPVQSTSALMEERFYSWTVAYASGVDLLHQVLFEKVKLLLLLHEGTLILKYLLPS